MILYTFGDSWTEGSGADVSAENACEDDITRKLLRNSLSWPKELATLLNINETNLSKTGSSNKEIFDKIVDTVKSGTITNKDLVIVMWSSSLRDDLPFFPKGEWHVWGKNYTEEKVKFDWVINSIKNNIKGVQYTKNPEYNFFLKTYKEFYIDNLFNNLYYTIVNQNYILFIQKLFETYNIRYLFCDAFDLMIQGEIMKDVDNTKFINKKHYYGFKEKTLKDHLLMIDPEDDKLWENNIKWGETVGKHPNKNGYKEIANELYRYIIDFDILKETPKKQTNLI